MKSYLIAGGSGYLGRLLTKYLISQGSRVTTLARSQVSSVPGERVVVWDPKGLGGWVKELEDHDVLINLCGRTVNCRYTKRNRLEMLNSRIECTKILGKALKGLKRPPKLWINSSTATIYQDSYEPQDELSGKLGKGFSVEIARRWEAELFQAEIPETVRRVALRSAMVFGPGEKGVFFAFKQIVGMGLGGPIAGGGQYVSWIHIEDFCRAIEWIVKDQSLKGPLNLSSPNPVTNRKLMRTLAGAKLLQLPTPEWLLELGAVVRRTESELLLKSRYVLPGRLLSSGFKFKFESMEQAAENLVG